MNTKQTILSIALALACGAANAIVVAPVIAVSSVQASPGLFTTKSNVCTVTFDTPASLGACSGVTYSASNGIASHIVSGSVGGEYAQPTNDATPYLTVGPSAGSPVTITLAAGANYFGFYAGSIDSYNSIMFTSIDGTSSVTLNGNDINAYLAPTAPNGTMSSYFNIFTTSLFRTITLSSSSNAMETDNHSFGIASATTVPEPGSVALLGLGTLALLMQKRRRKS